MELEDIVVNIALTAIVAVLVLASARRVIEMMSMWNPIGFLIALILAVLVGLTWKLWTLR